MGRSARGWWCTVVILAVVAGCSSPASSATPTATATTPAPTATATPTATPSPTPTPTPTPSPTPTPIVLCAKEDKSCPLEPGTYASAVFKPAFSFTVGEGWSNDWDFARLGAISDVPGSLVWQEGVDKTLGEDFGLDDVGSSPDALVAFLKDHPDLEVGPVTPVTVDGAQGLTVDVTPKRGLQGLFVTTPYAPQTSAGSKDRYIIVEVANTTVLFQITSDKAADFEAYMTRVQPIIDSIHWQ